MYSLKYSFFFEDILSEISADVQPHDMVRLTINSPLLSHEIWLPFMRPDQLDADRVMVEVDRVIQSNDEWLFDDFYVNFIHAPLPQGGGLARGLYNLDTFLEKKKCIIRIPKDPDMMCCARAIITAKARLDNDPDWNSIRSGSNLQYTLASSLQREAGIPLGTVCGKQEWEKFQQCIGNDYQLIICSRDYFNAIVYHGPQYAEKQLYLYHAENHFSVITSMPAFLQRSYFCKLCRVGYNNQGSHYCKLGCKYCRHFRACAFEKWRPCFSCNRNFVSEYCYRKHLEKGICRLLHACTQCGSTYHTYREHKCGEKYCNACKKKQPLKHMCYIQPLTTDEEEDESQQVYIFYDFECMLDEYNNHVPNLCVVHKVCGRCMETPITENTCDCNREQLIFRGESTLTEFCEWLFGGDNKGAICIAHNAQAYDLVLIVDYIHELGIKPDMIQNGRKILCLEACGLKFIDSLNFFNTSLAKLPKIFGLSELSKGYFPHLFSTQENQQYCGIVPDVQFYDPDGMKPDKREEFMAWYDTQTHFNFQEDLLKYCISDVDILQRCCGRFRSLFLEHTQDIEPFTTSVTIASACNKVYRSLYLKPEEIAVIPTHGYNYDKQSVIALCWMDWMAQQNQVHIRHAFNGGEVVLNGHKCDGFDEQNDVIYQFHGCFFHGCEKDYPNRSTVNPVNGQTMEDLRQQTRLVTKRLRANNHTVIEKWECDFKADILSNPDLQQFYESYKPYEPIQPRDAFFGGRVNAITLFYEPKPEEQIRYVDYTSLYPWVCKYGLFPIGHPTVYFGKDIPENICGLLKCKILPPADLYHPVLPERLRSKLVFTLCHTCAEHSIQTPCTHSDDQRALVGTWVSLEVDKAVDMGYRILEKYTAWHFPYTTKYDPTRREGGLWAEYMNLWLKEKQQADGYPSWCQSEEDRKKYIDDYFQAEGIHLDPLRIGRNEGLRSLSKICINSHWGKFAQQPNKTKVTYVSDPEEYISMMTDDALEITDLSFVNKEHIALKWKNKDEFVEPLPNTNVILAAFTSAQARLKLYSLLERLGDRVLYLDTDSVVYKHNETEWNPPRGDFLGQLKDETNDVPIVTFVSGGAKNYAYKLEDGSTVCKIRGFTLTHRNSMQLNFESMKELVTTPGEFEKPLPEKTSYEIKEPNKITNRNGKLVSVPHKKQYRLVYDKRILTPSLKTYPFGWKGAL